MQHIALLQRENDLCERGIEKNKEGVQAMHSKTSRLELASELVCERASSPAPYALISYNFYRSASAFRSPASATAVLALDFLTLVFDLISGLCRVSPPDSLDAKTILRHQILVLEILNEVAVKGITQVTYGDKIKNLIYRYC